jgi:hypothetical protein
MVLTDDNGTANDFQDDSQIITPLNFTTENGLYGAKAGPTRAVSDGYYLIFEPMPPGEHEIDIKSSLTNPTTGILFFADEVKYHLNVVAEVAESPSNSTSGQR